MTNIHGAGELVLLAATFSNVLNCGLIIVGAFLLGPGDIVNLACHPLVREGIHVLAAVHHALAIKSEVVVACLVIRTPDDRPFVAIKETRHTIELAVPPPQVVVVTVYGILRSGQHGTTGKNASVGHQLKRAWHDIVDIKSVRKKTTTTSKKKTAVREK